MKAQAEQLRPIAEAVLKVAQARITIFPCACPMAAARQKPFRSAMRP